MTRRVAVTRAQPEADATAARLRAAGAEPIVAPLLSIVAAPFDTSMDGVQAILFSSSNGVRAFADRSDQRRFLVLTVGDASAEAARAAGFADVRSADGDVDELAALAQRTLDPRAGRVLHVSGAHAAGDLAGSLRAAGFDAERRVAYEARAAASLPEALLQPIDVVLFHSARAAEIYLALGGPVGDRIAVCISPAVATAASKAAWRRIGVAPRARERDMLEIALAG